MWHYFMRVERIIIITITLQKIKLDRPIVTCFFSSEEDLFRKHKKFRKCFKLIQSATASKGQGLPKQFMIMNNIFTVKV